jgi:hypothetical protein
MQKRLHFHPFGLFLQLGVPPNLFSKLVCRKLKKVENHCLMLKPSFAYVPVAPLTSKVVKNDP